MELIIILTLQLVVLLVARYGGDYDGEGMEQPVSGWATCSVDRGRRQFDFHANTVNRVGVGSRCASGEGRRQGGRV